MLAPVTHILPLTSIRRSRVLPLSGHVLVSVGRDVKPADIIAEATIPSGHMVLDIRRGLGISQASAAERCIVRQQGDKLEKGDVIAESDGLFSRIVRAPVDGEIVSISGGQVLLRVHTMTMKVQAGFPGSVIEVIADRGAVIETNGALIQGVWGNGFADTGMLISVTQTSEEELTRQKIDVSMRGAILLAGHCSNADALQAGADLQLRGLVLSSMTADLLPVANSLKYPILVVEGFGKIPMTETAFKLLASSVKRDISVNAGLNPVTGERPELIIPLPAGGQAAPETDYFAPGKTVRIQGAPYAGKVGTLAQVRQGLITLPNGIKALAGDVQLGNDTRVTVPLANLEIIE